MMLEINVKDTARYQIGTVQQRYSQRGTKRVFLSAGIGLLIVNCGLFLFFVLEELGNGGVSRLLADVWGTYALGVFAGLGVVSVIYGLRSDRVAYVCSGGLLILRGREERRVDLILPWDHLTLAWERSDEFNLVWYLSVGIWYRPARQPPFYYISYRSGDTGTQTYRLFSKHLWQRCSAELMVRRSASSPVNEGRDCAWKE